MSSFSDFSDLGAFGIPATSNYEQIPPEKEFFKSVYITGQPRVNDVGVQEQIGKLQIRGFNYNYDSDYSPPRYNKLYGWD